MVWSAVVTPIMIIESRRYGFAGRWSGAFPDRVARIMPAQIEESGPDLAA